MVDTFKLDGAMVCDTQFDGSVLGFFAGVSFFKVISRVLGGFLGALTVCEWPRFNVGYGFFKVGVLSTK